VVEITNHFSKWADKLENTHIESVWANIIAPDRVYYQFHIKSGHFPHHHHLSILAEAHAGVYKVFEVTEGHSTLF
jgi:hypothetical protein